MLYNAGNFPRSQSWTMTEQNFKPYTEKQEKFGSWIINRVGRMQTTVYELTGGRVWNKFLGSPVAILTTVGRKTGKTRKTPLLYLMQDDKVIMTASKGGMTKLPIWYHNVKAAPSVHIQVGSEKKEYTMREANAGRRAGPVAQARGDV